MTKKTEEKTHCERCKRPFITAKFIVKCLFIKVEDSETKSKKTVCPKCYLSLVRERITKEDLKKNLT